MKIYVVIKSGLQEHGELSIASTEVAFSKKEKAEEHIKKFPAVWTEKVNGNDFFCERSICETELEE
jgi:hypothetical protein